MIKTTAMLLEELKEYASPANKLARMVANGDYVQIVKGLYETDKTVPGYLLAGSIYGPSYISFEYALSHHGLIPEAVYTITCASFEKKKKKSTTHPLEPSLTVMSLQLCFRLAWRFYAMANISIV